MDKYKIMKAVDNNDDVEFISLSALYENDYILKVKTEHSETEFEIKIDSSVRVEFVNGFYEYRELLALTELVKP